MRRGRMAGGALLATCLCAAPALAKLPGDGGPVSVWSEANARISGATLNELAAVSVAGAGDMNGDGRDDVIIGTPASASNARAYVVYGIKSGTPTGDDQYGSKNRPSVDLAKLGRRGFRIESGRDLGSYDSRSVAGAGDVNGDGRPDVILGAPSAAYNDRETSGSAFVVFGSAAAGDVTLTSLGAHGFRIDGATANEQAGTGVAGIGDVNGDGRDDLALTAPSDNTGAGRTVGSVYIVFGSASAATVDLANLGARGFRIGGADAVPPAVAGAGDVNGDGRDDIVVGTASPDATGALGGGGAYVIFGSPTPVNLDLASLGSAGFAIANTGPAVAAGASVAGAGDVNGDHLADVIVGAPGRSPDKPGNAYVVFGSRAAANVDLASLGARGFHIHGFNGFLGASVAGAGDVNGDHLDDLVIGEPEATVNTKQSVGTVYVVYGSKSGADVNLRHLKGRGFLIDGDNDALNNGSQVEANRAGTSVAGAGDFNGDGRDDVIFGAPTTKVGIYHQGAAWIVSVQKPLPGPPKRKRRPHIVGSPHVGQTLRCDPGTWDRATKFLYTWVRDSISDPKPVAARELGRFAGQTHRLEAFDRGHVYACIVYASGPAGSTFARSTAVRVT